MNKILARNTLFVMTIILILYIGATLAADIPRTLYVLNGSAETLSKMNMETENISMNVVATGQIPNQILAHNEMIYLVNSGTDNVMVIDPRTDQVVKTIGLPAGSNPWFMAFTGTNKAYVTNQVANTVSVIDVQTESVIKNISVGTGPQGIIVVGDRVFVANTGFSGGYGQATVSIIDVKKDSVTHSLNVPTNAQDLAVDAYGRIHVICTGNYATSFGQVAVIDLYTGPMWDTPAVVDTIDIGSSPGDIVITASGKGYCVAWGDGTNGHLYEYDALEDTVTHNAANPILVGPNVSRLLYDGQQNALWIPYMSVWGGDGFAQKFDLESNSVVWTSAVLGNGVQDFAILEPVFDTDPWADAIVTFTPGTGAGFGQNYMPDNVLGPPDPDPAVNTYTPSSNPQEILSLGSGGEIVLQFTDNKIINGEGVDFTIFENTFISWDGSVYMEAGIVSVSQDGQAWYQFPYDTTDMSGLAGVTPIGDNQNPTDPAVSGGDQFDLNDVDLNWASHVKITDLGDIYQEGIMNGDFDLDAVVAVNSEITAIANESIAHNPVQFQLEQNYPNPFNPNTRIKYQVARQGNVKLTVYNALGQKVRTLVNSIKQAGHYSVTFNANGFASGVYYYKLVAGNSVQIRKMVLIR